MNNPFVQDYDLSEVSKIKVNKFGFDFYTTPRFTTHYVAAPYEELSSLLIRQNVKSCAAFIDIGAHHGFFSVLVGLENAKCKIFSFEPIPENFSILQKNLEFHGLQSVMINKAVSNFSGSAEFQVSAASDNSGFVANPNAHVINQVMVETCRVDDYLPHFPNGPLLIKIDTEGNEIDVLAGMQETINKVQDIRLVIEFNPKCLKTNGHSPQMLLDVLMNLGFDIFIIQDDQLRFCKYDPNKNWIDYCGETAYINLYCVKKTKSLNLLIFSHSSGLNGAERSLLELLDELSSDYAAICTVVFPSHGILEEKMKDKGIATMVLPINWWCAEKGHENAKVFEAQSLRSYRSLYENLAGFRQMNFDIVLTNTLVIPWGAVLASLLNKPHIWMVNEFGELDLRSHFYIPFQKILGFIEDSSDHIVTRSKAIQNKLFINQNSAKVQAIYPYIDVTKPDKFAHEPNKQFFQKPGSFHLIISGTIFSEKGQEDAVRSVIELNDRRGRDVELIMLGQAQWRYMRHLKALIRSELGGRDVRFIKFSDNPFSIVKQADAVLMCSKIEGFGRVTLEAMLLKKPVIATNTGGTIEMIFDGVTGLLYTPGDYLHLADQIEKLMNNPQLRKDLTHNAYEYAIRMFSKAGFGGKYYSLLSETKQNGYKPKPEIEWFVAPYAEKMLVRRKKSLWSFGQQIKDFRYLENYKRWKIVEPLRKLVHFVRENL